jgi:16S rRNA (guanine527-N7)-methyltransferase
LGTGGGLPGIPIAIARPDLLLCLADSIRKKSTALDEMVRVLELPNVDVVNGRVEDLGRSGPHKHSFGGVIARAVAPLSQLVKWSRPLLVNGKTTDTTGQDHRSPTVPFLLALKGGDLSSEVAGVSHAIGKGVRRIDTIAMDFLGVETAGLEGKKIAIVEFT